MSEAVTIQGKDSNGLPKYVGMVGDASKVAVQSLPTLPANDYKIISTVRTATDVLTITALHGYHSGAFAISGLTGETISITLLADGGGAMGVPLLVKDTAPATVIAGTTLGNGNYTIHGVLNAATMVFTKSAAVETATIYGQLSGAA